MKRRELPPYLRVVEVSSPPPVRPEKPAPTYVGVGDPSLMHDYHAFCEERGLKPELLDNCKAYCRVNGGVVQITPEYLMAAVARFSQSVDARALNAGY